METTKLFQIVRRMPKGALLHAHIGATVDLSWVFMQAIWTPGMGIACSVALDSREAREKEMVRFAFVSGELGVGGSIWEKGYEPGRMVSLREAAESFPKGGKEGFVGWMKDRCSITQEESLQPHLGVDDVWRKLSAGFVMLHPILYYEPLLRGFIRKLLITLLEDGVRWAELRAVFASPFTLEGQGEPVKRPLEVARVLSEGIREFMGSEEGKGFWGVRMIWTAMRGQNTEIIIEGILVFSMFEFG